MDSTASVMAVNREVSSEPAGMVATGRVSGGELLGHECALEPKRARTWRLSDEKTEDVEEGRGKAESGKRRNELSNERCVALGVRRATAEPSRVINQRNKEAKS